ncbi:MAG: glycosyltransferase [Nitrososphaerota archaeon]|nr:glycosyltransferase [Nitrososphaerota archaeon]
MWGPFGFRADELAQEVGAERVSITFLYGPRYFAPVRYLVLFFRTLLLLSRAKPDVVYAQNPPVFCPLTCLLYCRARGVRLVIDHHSVWRVKTLGRGPLSRAIGFLEGVVARSAYANTAPHRFWADQLGSMGANRVAVVHDFVEKNRHPRDGAVRARYSGRPLIAMCSHGGHPLERLESEATGVGRVEGVELLISGPAAKLDRRLRQMTLPKNVKYIGFLQRDDYESLKASVDMAVNITDEPYTLSHVLLEYAASSLPVVSSRQEVVEEFFGDSLLYTDSTEPDAVAAGVERFKDPSVLADYRARVTRWYERASASREGELKTLRALLNR